jgi:hypothetical protein
MRCMAPKSEQLARIGFRRIEWLEVWSLDRHELFLQKIKRGKTRPVLPLFYYLS